MSAEPTSRSAQTAGAAILDGPAAPVKQVGVIVRLEGETSLAGVLQAQLTPLLGYRLTCAQEQLAGAETCARRRGAPRELVSALLRARTGVDATFTALAEAQELLNRIASKEAAARAAAEPPHGIMYEVGEQ